MCQSLSIFNPVMQLHINEKKHIWSITPCCIQTENWKRNKVIWPCLNLILWSPRRDCFELWYWSGSWFDPQKHNRSYWILNDRSCMLNMHLKWHNIAAVLHCPWKVSVVSSDTNRLLCPLTTWLCSRHHSVTTCTHLYWALITQVGAYMRRMFKGCLFSRTVTSSATSCPVKSTVSLLLRERADQAMYDN